MRLTKVQTTFASGEIDPKLRAQTNLKAYNEGLRRARNLARLATGGMERRNGTLDLAALPGLTRLVDFEFSSTQRYIIAFYDEGATIFDTVGTALDTVTACPWTDATIFEMSYTQNGDTMIVTHHDFLVMLVRDSYSTFHVEQLAFPLSADDLKRYQPYFKFSADDVTLTPSAATGTITLLASAPVFDVGHNGLRFRIFGNEVELTAITDSTHATADVQGTLETKLDLDALKTTAGSGVVEVSHLFHGFSSGQSIELSGANDVGNDDTGANGISGANLTGTFTLTVIDENSYKITAAAGDTAAVSEDGGGSSIKFRPVGSAVRDWKEPSISPVRGYPASCCFHEQRLWLAGTPSQPDGYFGSNSLRPMRFDVGSGYDGESVQGSAGMESLSTIRHMISNGDLQIFTPTGEGIFVTRAGDPITPSNQKIEAATGSGSGFVMPQIFDGATLFVQENGLSVSEFVYSQTLSRYTATPVSTLASHFLEPGVVDCAVSPGTTSRAEQYAFFPIGAVEMTTDHDVSDGDLVVFHSMRAENIAGWVKWRLGDGKVRSVAAVGSDVFLAVERGGAFRLYKFEPGEFYSLDGAVEHISGTGPKTNWTLDARVRSRTMAVISERGYHGMVDVPASGVITLSLPVERLLVGDPYFYELETLTPTVQLATGGQDRMVKRIVRVIVEFERTASAVIDGAPLQLRPTGADPSIAPEPFTGSYEFRKLGFDRNPTVTITQQEPTFARILGMTMEVSV